jgi:hypothetical protein
MCFFVAGTAACSDGDNRVAGARADADTGVDDTSDPADAGADITTAADDSDTGDVIPPDAGADADTSAPDALPDVEPSECDILDCIARNRSCDPGPPALCATCLPGYFDRDGLCIPSQCDDDTECRRLDSVTEWSACTFDGVCAIDGRRTRTVTAHACGNGRCNPNARAETEVCGERVTDDQDCSNGDEQGVCSAGVCATAPPAPSDVSASDGSRTESVRVQWSEVAGASGYYIYRDGARITEEAVTGLEYLDTQAVAFTPDAPLNARGSTDRADGILLSWEASRTNPGRVHSYRVSAINLLGEGAQSVADEGARGAIPVSGYQVEFVGTDTVIPLGVQLTYLDGSAPEPTVSGGDADASDGVYPDRVELTLLNALATDGDPQQYVVRATTTLGDSPPTLPFSGQRSAGGLQVQWQRATVDSPGSYTDLAGVTGLTANDLTAPADLTPRFYRARVTAGEQTFFSTTDAGRRGDEAPAAPRNVRATDRTFTDRVEIAWDRVAGATGYIVIRDNVPLFATPITATFYADRAADLPTLPAPIRLAATDGQQAVILSWDRAQSRAGTIHAYRVIAIGAGGESPRSDADAGNTSEYTNITYEIRRNGGSWISVGTDQQYFDTAAPAPLRSIGSAVASDGTQTDRVDLELLDYEVRPAEEVTYDVRAQAAGLTSPVAGPVSGKRVIVPRIRWERSLDNTPTTFESISGGAAEPTYSDFLAPEEGYARFYRAVLDLSGAGLPDLRSAPDSGFIFALPPDRVIGLQATDEEVVGGVLVTWRSSRRAVGYHVFRDGEQITDELVTALEYFDTESAPAGLIPAPDNARATRNDRTRVRVSWDAVGRADAREEEYWVVGVGLNGDAPISNIDLGSRAKNPIAGYEVSVNGGAWQDVGLTTGWVDPTAPAPGFVTTIDASDDISRVYVTVDSTIASRDGASRTYSVRAYEGGDTGAGSPSATGFRPRGAFTWSWQYADDSSAEADFFALPGDEGASFVDFDAPSSGAPRYYRIVASGIGFANYSSAPEPGSVSDVPVPTVMGDYCVEDADCGDGGWCSETATLARCAPLLFADDAVPYRMLWVLNGSHLHGQGGDIGSFSSTLSRGFFLGQIEVTHPQWSALVDANPSAFLASTDCEDALCPVDSVALNEVAEFLNALSADEGLDECYAISGCDDTPVGEGRLCDEVDLASGFATPYACNGYRLPTSVEWEYAARLGPGTTNFIWGDGLDDVDVEGFAVFADNSTGVTSPVAQKASSFLGFYDLAGNVAEWVWESALEDGPIYPASARTNYLSYDPEDPAVVVRGGHYNSEIDDMRNGATDTADPAVGAPTIGFRIARSLPFDLPVP